MSKIIVKQPNGLYCLYSTIEDNITFFNATADDIVEYYSARYREEIKKKIEADIKMVDDGWMTGYCGRDLTHKSMIKLIQEIHGEDEAEKVSSLISLPPKPKSINHLNTKNKKDVDLIDVSKHPFDAELNIENAYQSFFDFMNNEHGLILTHTEMEDIIREAKKY